MKSISFTQQLIKRQSIFSIKKLIAFLFVVVSFVSMNETNAQNITQANFTAVVAPQYTIAANSTTRMPVMFRATVSGLTANTTYKYFTQAALSTDFAGTSLAGNSVLVNSAGTAFAYTTSPGYGTVGTTCESFTTNASGSYTGWFGLVATTNAKFTAGNVIYPTISIATATTTLFRYALDQGITCIAPATTAGVNNGSLFQCASNSGATAKNFVAIYDNTSATGRPLAVTFVETAVTIASVPTGYTTTSGGWNAIIPNGTSGYTIKRIDQYSASSGSLLCSAINASGYGNTTTPSAQGATFSSISTSLANVTPSVSATITTGAQSSCVNTTVGFTATPTNGGTSPSYQWKLNSTNVGTNATTYSSSSFANNDAVGVVMTPGTDVCVSSTTATASTITLTRNVYLTPSVTAVVDDNTAYPGQLLSFTATPTNGGSGATYQWYVDGSLVSGQTSALYQTNSLSVGSHTVYAVLTASGGNNCYSPTTATSNNVTLSVDGSACTGTPNTGTTNATSTNVCSGGSTILSLTGLGTTTNISYQWQSSNDNVTYNNVGVTTATYTPTNITAATWYRCIVTCDNSLSSTPSTGIQINVTANLTPAVTIASSLSPACAGASVTYTATPTNGGASPSYAWYKNGSLVSGQTSATYTSTSFADGDQIYVVLTSNYVCVTTPTATSNTATQNITANVAASVLIASSANPSCAGASVTFTATPTNEGTTPSYQWYNGATPISGATNPTYTSSSLTNGASITVRMTSSITCVTGSPATSNAVVQTVTANVTPSVSIVSSNPIICNSGSTTFTATPTNGGTTPVYTWYLNGSVVSGQTASTYTLSPVSNNDAVYVVLTSSITCVTTATATSSTLTETVTTPSTPSVSVSTNPAAVSGTVSVNNGSNITFTATPTFGGTTPTYQWKLNNVNINGATSSTYSTATLNNNDVVSCIMVSNYACLVSGSATQSSNNITIAIVSNTPFTPGNILVYRAGSGGNLDTLKSNGNAVYLDEYTQSGTFVQSTRLTKSTTSASNLSIVATGTGSSDGALTLNTNGLNVAVPGYYAYTGYPSTITSTTGASVNRVAALVDRNQNVDTTTRLSDWSSGNNARGVVANGNDIYVLGAAGGIRYAAKGASTSTQLSTTPTNLRVANIFNGQLYVSSSSGTTRLATVGTGIPTSGTTNAITNLAGTDIPALTSPYGFFFASSSIVYVADDNNKSTTIRKFQFNGTNWVAAGTLALDTAVRGLTGYVSGGNVTLFASTGGTLATGGMNAIYKITESLGSSNITSSYSKIVNVASANNFIAFRGICFAPTSITTQPTNTIACAGVATSINITMAAGTNAIYNYQWQVSNNGGSSWSNISNNAVYNNVTTSSLTISEPSGLNNNQYRCVITYMGNATLTSNAATLTVPTTVTPSVSISTSSTTVCSSDIVTFTASGVNGGSAPVYQWKKNGNSVATGSSINFPANTLSNGDVVTCVLTANNNCQTTATATSNAITMTVNQSPAAATISSRFGNNTTAFAVCSLGTIETLYPSILGGVWSSSNTAVATVANAGSSTSTSNVTAVSNGTANMIYTLQTPNTSCTTSSTVAVTVAQQATPNAVTGVSNICVGGTTTFATTSTGGVFSTTGRLNINASTGFATAVNSGATTVKYTITNAAGCSASSALNVTVNALPATPSFAYASGTTSPQTTSVGGVMSLCANRNFTLVGNPANGVWSKTGAWTITPTGTNATNVLVNTGNTNGAVSVTYEITNANGCKNSRTINANVVTCSSKGVNNQLAVSNEQLVVYPNPAHSTINLSVKTLTGSGSIVVTDLYGKTIKQQALSMGINTIDVSSFAKGMYLVSVITEQGKQTQKVVVE